MQRSRTVNKGAQQEATGGSYAKMHPNKKVHDSLIFEKMMRDKMRKMGPLEKNSTEYSRNKNAAFRKTTNQQRSSAIGELPDAYRSVNSSVDEQGAFHLLNMSTATVDATNILNKH